MGKLENMIFKTVKSYPHTGNELIGMLSSGLFNQLVNALFIVGI